MQPNKNQTQQVIDAIKKNDIKDAVLKILYHIPETEKDSIDLKMIQNFCRDAIYIVGVIPIRKLNSRNRRAVIKVDMKLSKLLDVYFDSKEKLKSRKKN